MKKSCAALLACLAASAAALAGPVSLSLAVTAYDELFVPGSIEHIPYAAPILDDPATEFWNESLPAVAEEYVVRSTYRLGYKVKVADLAIGGVVVEIAPASAPEFVITMRMTPEVFAQKFPGDAEGLMEVLAGAGSISPGPALAEAIRALALVLLAAP